MRAGRNRAAWGGFVLLCSAAIGAAAALEWAGDGPPPPAAPGPTAGPTLPDPTRPAAPSPTPPPGFPASLAGAEALYREGRFEEARRAFEAAAREGRDGATVAEAWFGAGRAAEAAGDRDGAAEAFSRAAEAAPGGSDVGARSSYRLLRALNDAGRFLEAAAVPPPVGGAIAPYARYERGRALAGAGDAAGAAAAWETLATDAALPTPVRARALEGLAGLARQAGDAAALGRWLDARIALDGAAAARYERAILARDAGDTATFGRLLREILATAPLAREATLAIGELEAAGEPFDAGQAGFILYRRGAYAEAVRRLTAAVEEAGLDPATRTFRAYYLAAAYEELGQADAAVAWYDTAAGTGAQSPFVHSARYWAARVLENAGRLDEAAPRYLALVVEGPPGEFSQEAAFRAGYTRYLAGDISGALASWERAAVASSPRLEYWRGRALVDAGDAAAAAEAFGRAAELDRFDFYALEAAERLGTPRVPRDVGYVRRDLGRGIDWEAIGGWLASRIGGGWTGAPATGACELRLAGLDDEARAALQGAAAGAGAWRLLELAREAHQCGLPHLAIGFGIQVRTAAGAAPWEAPPDLLRVVYPVDFAGALDRAAAAHGIDPLFLAALVRAESLWDPRAGSVAGALGLTQVIPSTGEGIARALGVPGFAAADLFRPGLSLEFGAYYLGLQLRRFGEPVLALAAYNAGPGNAARWAAHADAGAAALVEGIDFGETHAYVRVILEGYAYYLLAWGE